MAAKVKWTWKPQKPPPAGIARLRTQAPQFPAGVHKKDQETASVLKHLAGPPAYPCLVALLPQITRPVRSQLTCLHSFFLLKEQITFYFFFREYYKSIVIETHDQIKLKEEISKEKIIAEICEKINYFCIYLLVFPFPIYLSIIYLFNFLPLLLRFIDPSSFVSLDVSHDYVCPLVPAKTSLLSGLSGLLLVCVL